MAPDELTVVLLMCDSGRREWWGHGRHYYKGHQMTGGELLAQMIRDYYLTDTEVARRAGVHINTIKSLKKNTNEPTAATVRKVAVVFDRGDDSRLACMCGWSLTG